MLEDGNISRPRACVFDGFGAVACSGILERELAAHVVGALGGRKQSYAL